MDFQINSFIPFISLSHVGEGQGEGKYQKNVKLLSYKTSASGGATRTGSTVPA